MDFGGFITSSALTPTAIKMIVQYLFYDTENASLLSGVLKDE